MTVPSLSKGDIAQMSGHVRIGAAWDASARGYGGLMGKLSRKAGGDLDALAILCQDGQPVRMAGIGNNDPLKNGTVLHSGDNTTGRGEGDDETIDLHLDRIDADVTEIVLVVAAFKVANKRMGDDGFGGVENVEFNVYDMTGGQTKVFRIMPSLLGAQNVCLVAKLTRSSYGWDMLKLNTMVRVEHGNTQALLRSALNA